MAADLHAQELDDVLHGVLQLLELLQRKLLLHVAVVRGGFPRASEVAERDLGHVVRRVQVQSLHRIVLLEAVLVALDIARVRVNLHHPELELTVEARVADRRLGVAREHHEARALHAVDQFVAFDGEDLVVELGLAVLHLHAHVHQLLLGYRVRHVELQHDVAVKDVFHTLDHILRLALRQLHRRARPEHAAQLAQLRDRIHRGGSVHHLRVRGQPAAARRRRATRRDARVRRKGIALGHRCHGLFHHRQRVDAQRLAILHASVRRVELHSLFEVRE
mmetsp:Transcript_70961/g.199028  ORF Transcript_70961/g.199028 Transcript_70961/m.199028 type:complete len:277 (-) Transcript_70961:1955-2785(-)